MKTLKNAENVVVFIDKDGECLMHDNLLHPRIITAINNYKGDHLNGEPLPWEFIMFITDEGLKRRCELSTEGIGDREAFFEKVKKGHEEYDIKFYLLPEKAVENAVKQLEFSYTRVREYYVHHLVATFDVDEKVKQFSDYLDSMPKDKLDAMIKEIDGNGNHENGVTVDEYFQSLNPSYMYVKGAKEGIDKFVQVLSEKLYASNKLYGVQIASIQKLIEETKKEILSLEEEGENKNDESS